MLKAAALYCLLGVSLGVSSTASAQSTPENSPLSPLDEWLRGLDYDPRSLLAAAEPGSTESLPGRSNGRDGVIICTSKPQGLTENLDEVTVLSPISGVVYPGALVRANRALADGKPDPIGLKHGSIKLSVDLPGMGNDAVRTVVNPSYSAVQTAINEMLSVWNDRVHPEGYVNPARSSYNVHKAYTQTQIALQLGFGTKWASNSITSNLKVDNNAQTSTTIKLFRQVFYTVTTDSPERPSGVFAPGTALSDVQQVVDDQNPPAYVRSVDYGRIILVRMDTDSNETEADLEAALNYVTTGGTEVSGETANKLTRIVSNSRFTVLTLGGNAEVASQTMNPSDLDAITDVIRQNSVYRRDNPGYPIAYTVAFLKDNSVAVITFSTNYTKSDCVSYPNGFVKLQHSGAYVARFFLDWIEKDESGLSDIPRSWSSGNVTAGWQATQSLPGDATKVHIRGEAQTGLFWQPWNEALDRTINGPDNKCYRVTGTTLAPGWDHGC